jgi:hypothetical protein
MIECDICIGVILVLLLIIVGMSYCSSESFSSRPTPESRRQIVGGALANQHVFDPRTGSFNAAKGAIPGLDNITYEDFRTLHRKGQFTSDRLDAALST